MRPDTTTAFGVALAMCWLVVAAVALTLVLVANQPQQESRPVGIKPTVYDRKAVVIEGAKP